ncbi:unnamed protein product [Closterium sp. NIES-65]|nr:unnamed protein product [Closterium sp. NIES-65]
MSSQRLVLGLPRVLPSLPPSPAPPCRPCVEGRLRATPHSSSLRPATEPFETLHLDVVAHHRGHSWSSCQLSPLRPWGEFRSGILAGFCREQGIRQSWTLPESPQQNGVAERRIGLVMEIARTSLTHACAPHFLWPYAVSLWTGFPGVASRFRVWGCLALVRDTSADKLSPRAVPCVFLGFPEDSSDFTFYHPPSHRFFDSRDVRFEESHSVLRVSQATPPPSVAPPVQPPSPQSSSQRAAGASSREVGAEDACRPGAGAGRADTGGAASGGEGAPPLGSVFSFRQPLLSHPTTPPLFLLRIRIPWVLASGAAAGMYAFVSLGCYAVGALGYGLMRFPTCQHEGALLRQDIVEAKEYLSKHGLHSPTHLVLIAPRCTTTPIPYLSPSRRTAPSQPTTHRVVPSFEGESMPAERTSLGRVLKMSLQRITPATLYPTPASPSPATPQPPAPLRPHHPRSPASQPSTSMPSAPTRVPLAPPSALLLPRLSAPLVAAAELSCAAARTSGQRCMAPSSCVVPHR